LVRSNDEALSEKDQVQIIARSQDVERSIRHRHVPPESAYAQAAPRAPLRRSGRVEDIDSSSSS
jgi:hypothetical protein